MNFTLNTVFDKITAYERIQKKFKFQATGLGNAAWSHQFVNDAGEVLTVRNSEWTLCEAGGAELASGTEPIDLALFLTNRMSREDLVMYASQLTI